MEKIKTALQAVTFGGATVATITVLWILAVIGLPSLCWGQESYSNAVMKKCLEENGYSIEKFDTFDFRKAAKCHSDFRVGQNIAKLEEIRTFLDENPRYRYPGQSNNRCFGKPRELAFKSIEGTAGDWGWHVNIKYKEKIKPCIIGPFKEDPYDTAN